MSKKKYKLNIKPLTGIHIGSGETVTPLDYTVKTMEFSEGKKQLYFKFSSDKILHRIIEEGNKQKISQFEEISNSENIKRLQTFFQHECKIPADMEYLSDVTKTFLDRYRHNINKDPLDNAAAVLQMYRPTGKKAPVIPGSSIKGAIRTALLDFYLNPQKDDSKLKSYRKSKDLEAYLLKYDDGLGKSDMKKDPLRCISIADCTIPAKGTQLVGCLKNISRNLAEDTCNELDKLQITAEIIRGVYIDGKSESQTQLLLDTDLQNPELRQINQKISAKDIVSACNYFYWDTFTDEFERFYRDETEHTKYCEQLYKDLETINKKNDTQFIIRLGRWSQVEFMTYSYGFALPKTKNNKYGGTRTVFDYNGNYVPMGWCVCSLEEINEK
ncbi:MAG: type III-A CRISPR-associated RAMP protein Csm5 [Treponema sp. CETP13]|nr:MAG: type III-A CRISPR-associated RAMP protein Csm5 [Treponema sp. CETP13]